MLTQTESVHTSIGGKGYNDKRSILKRQAVTTRGALLTQVLKVDEQARTAPINLTLSLLTDERQGSQPKDARPEGLL
jgi:hypothetical protein